MPIKLFKSVSNVIQQDGTVGNGCPLPWASWTSTDNYLPPMFYTKESNASLPAFRKWITTNPITTDGDTLASYQQVEVVALGFGLSLRGLWIAQFTDQYNRVPDYVENSPYSFDEYEKLCGSIGTLTADYEKRCAKSSPPLPISLKFL